MYISVQRVVLYDNPGLLEYFFSPARFIMETFILFFLSIFFFCNRKRRINIGRLKIDLLNLF